MGYDSHSVGYGFLILFSLAMIGFESKDIAYGFQFAAQAFLSEDDVSGDEKQRKNPRC